MAKLFINFAVMAEIASKVTTYFIVEMLKSMPSSQDVFASSYSFSMKITKRARATYNKIRVILSVMDP